MATAAHTDVAPPPLTVLSEEERLFQATVRQFANEQIRPYVREMDEAAAFRKEIIRQRLATGGQALVYRAMDQLLSRPVVVKFLRTEGRQE